MYGVSGSFFDAMHRPVQTTRLRGTIKTKNREIAFTEENVIKGKFSLSGQCSGTSNVEIGSVYVSELDAEFIGLQVERYSLENAVITARLELLTDFGFEAVPLGIYNVKEAEWGADTITVTAYDNMIKLDKPCDVSSAIGTLYDLAIMACNKCGLELGNTWADLWQCANGRRTLSMYTENDIETWRDFLYWLAAACGCFVMADREGKIVLREYSRQPVDSLSNYERFTGEKYADYETRYTGLSVVNIAKRTTSYYGLQPDDGLTYKMGSNPFLQYGVDEEITEMRREVLGSLSVIKYVPMEVSMIGSPAYELGDVLIFRAGIADSSKLYCITQYDWTYGGEYAVKGVGQNPALATARSKVDKNIAGLMAQMDDSKLNFTMFTNPRAINIADGKSKVVIQIRFTAAKSTPAVIDMGIPMKIETTEKFVNEVWTENDAYVRAEYYLDGEELVFYPAETYQDGKHILRLRYDLRAAAMDIHTWEVKLWVTGGKIYIGAYDIQAMIMGNGIAGSDEWNGIIQVYEDVEPYRMDIMYGRISDIVGAFKHIPKRRNPEETMQRLVLPNMFGVISDSVGDAGAVMTFSPWVNADKVTTTCTVDNSRGWIGNGTGENAKNVTTVAVSGVTGATVSTDGATFTASFDGGNSWYGWRLNEGWVEGLSMSKAAIESIPEAEWAYGTNVIIKADMPNGTSLYSINLRGGRISND